MYWNTIDGNRQKLLKKITERISLNNYYMMGGTALSLQLGLRLSYDFDFCVSEQFLYDPQHCHSVEGFLL